jgi:hypothetical protein
MSKAWPSFTQLCLAWGSTAFGIIIGTISGIAGVKFFHRPIIADVFTLVLVLLICAVIYRPYLARLVAGKAIERAIEWLDRIVFIWSE